MATTKTKKIGKYEILDVVGKGGMGIVYKAVDPSIGRMVAIKMITGNFAEDAGFLKRFYREAQSTGKLQHPNIVIVHDLGEHEGNPFLVMEFLEGESLDSIIKSKRSLPLLEKLNFITQTCNGLQYAHERNVVHRDIKPANLMVLTGGVVKIVDFGIARIEDDSNVTMPSMVMGTIQYMSPEQINGKHVDGRTDVFSTAVVLYQLLTDHLPFDAGDTGSTLLKIINEPAAPLSKYLPGYPAELDAILERALAKSRDDRYQSAEELAFDLSQVQEQLRREAASEYLRVAQELMEKGELSKAREQCLQLLRFDRQDNRAKQLLQQIQQRVQRQQRDEQARQLRDQAHEAMSTQDYERAVLYLCQAVELDPANAELMAFRETAREAKLRADQHREAFKRAQSAHYAGDLTDALQAVEQALTLDSADTDAQALRAEITHEIEQRKRQMEIQGLVEEAQRQIASRQFTAALDALRKAAALDPVAPGVRELMTLAATGREQELRRKEMERLSAAITDALGQDDFAAACERADEALKQFPEDRGLLKLKAMAERRRAAAEKRQFIEEQVSNARKLLDRNEAETALKELETACQRYPNEPALLSVLTIVRQTIQQEKEEARKRDYLQRAREALRNKNFAEAVEVLEAGCAEFNAPPELEDLLQFAHEEAAAFEHQQRVEAAASEARRLMSAEEFEQAIAFLRTTLDEVADQDLEIILADAERQLEEFKRRVADCVETAERLLRVDRAAEAVRYLESQAPALSRSSRFREITARARECQERLRRIADAVESARRALGAHDWKTAQATIEECRQACGDHPELARLAAQMAADRAEAASAAVSRATNDCRMLFLGRSYEAAMQLLDQVTNLVEFVPEELRLRHTAMYEEAERGVLYKQQQAERARAQSDLSTKVDDTAERTAWAVDATTHHATDVEGQRGHDMGELQQLAHEAETTATLEELSAISARARVLAERHPKDSEVQSVATSVFTTAEFRAESITSIGQPRPSRMTPPPIQEPPEPAAPPPPPAPPVEAARPEPVIPTRAPEPPQPAAVAPRQPAPWELEEAAQAQESIVAAQQDAQILRRAETASQPAPPAESKETTPIEAELPSSQPGAVAPAEEDDVTVARPIPVRFPGPPSRAGVARDGVEAAGLPLAAGAENAAVTNPRAPGPARVPPPSPRRERSSAPAATPKDRTISARPVSVRGVETQRPIPVPSPAIPKLPKLPKHWMAVGGAAVLVIAGVLTWRLWPSAPASSGIATGKPLVIVSSTPAGAVVQVQNETCVTPNCRLQLSPGDYEIKASLAGYKPESRIVHVSAGATPPPVSLALEPLPTVVRINTNFSSGDVTLDGKAIGSLRQGQLQLPNLAAGSHTVKVSTPSESAEMTFNVVQARPPELPGAITAQGASAFAVSTLTGQARLTCVCTDGTRVVVDGRDVGQIQSGRRDLGALPDGSHQLQVGEGDNSATHIVRVSGTPGLDIFLDAQRDVGILVVQALADASVFIDGRKAGATGSDGVYRTTVPVKPVSVRVSKTGYRTPPPQTAELHKNGETGLNFDLQPISDKAKLLVAGGQPDTSISVDGKAIGSLDKAGQFASDIAPGNHTVEISRNGFQPKTVNRSFTAGETTRLTADLAPSVTQTPPKGQTQAAGPSSTSPAPPLTLPPTVKTQPSPAAPSPDQLDWQKARDSKDPAVVEAFLSRYPGSPLADQARDRLRQLQLSSDRSGILQTLKRYADAYEHKSADEVEAVWPTLDKGARKKIAESFKSADSIKVDLRPSGDPSFSGDTATVTCDRNLLYTFPGGAQKPVADRIVVRLRKKSGTWLIESVS